MQAAIARVQDDHVPSLLPGVATTVKRDNFEEAASYLLPSDPVARRRSTSTDKRSVAEISTMDAQDKDKIPRKTFQKFKKVSGKGKQGIGKSGVHLRYHTPEEYTALTRIQRSELAKWRLKNPRPPANDGNTSRSSSIAAAVAKWRRAK